MGVGITGRKWEDPIPIAITMTPGPPLANTMMNRRRNSMMKATETRYYYNADENLCADEDFVIYFLCGMEGLTAEEVREGLHTKREFYGWFDTSFRCKEDIHNGN